jgi:hypothetical protein
MALPCELDALLCQLDFAYEYPGHVAAGFGEVRDKALRERIEVERRKRPRGFGFPQRPPPR